ncbi:MAG: response regulator receiver protein [Chitinophagaceae bacterium]|nr:response regulator receiver protein [Chitinophagaceae bacterium]
MIDDEPDFLFTVSSILKRKGFRVITGHGAYGIGSILEKKPDLILLDINMPGKSGSEICRQLKAGAETQNIPIILISGNADIQPEYVESYADNYLQKPFGVTQLINIINHSIVNAV